MKYIIDEGSKEKRIGLYFNWCSTCGCEFLYEKDDVHYGAPTMFTGRFKHKYVYCPNCEKKLDDFEQLSKSYDIVGGKAILTGTVFIITK